MEHARLPRENQREHRKLRRQPRVLQYVRHSIPSVTITEAQVDTTAEAVSPTLVEVRDRFTSRIRQAEDSANDLLDEELARRREDRPVVKIESRLRGREIASREQLAAVVAELEERIGPARPRPPRPDRLTLSRRQAARYFRFSPFANLTRRLHELPNLSCNRLILQNILRDA